MKKISKTIIFFGTDSYSLHALKALVENDYDVSVVVTKPDSRSGRGHKLIYPAVKDYAISKNIEVWQPQKAVDIIDKLKTITNMVGILSSYGKILPKDLLDLFTPGIINIHPSLLPKYRGASPIESAILNNDAKTGVSIMLLTPGMDDGPIYAQESYNLKGIETGPELYEELGKIGAAMLIEKLPSILDNQLVAKTQDSNQATYCSMINKDAAWLDPEHTSSDKCEQIVRAYLGYPKTKYNIRNNQIIIKKAHTSNIQETAIDLKCSDNKYLVIDSLIAPSGKTMNANEFINGYLKQ